MTESVERDYYVEAKAKLKRLADALPPETDPELRAMYSHPAVIEWVAASMELDGDIYPTSFRQIIKDYEEQKLKEEQRLRLQTSNPPKSWSEAGREQAIYALVFLVATVVFAISTILLFALSSSRAFWLLTLLPSIGCGILTAVKANAAKEKLAKWSLVYRTISYEPPLKNGRLAQVERSEEHTSE